MKKILLLILFSSLAFSQIKYAESEVGGFFPINDGKPWASIEDGAYNTTALSFYYYSNDSNDIRITYDTHDQVSFKLSKDERIVLIKYFEKYIEWADKATKAELELNKRIQIKINETQTEKATLHSLYDNSLSVFNNPNILQQLARSGKLEEEREDRDIYIKFFSQNKKRHQIILNFSLLEDEKFGELFNKSAPKSIYRIDDYKNNFILYFDYDQAVDFKNFISEDYLDLKRVVFD
tara:strand:- start:97 stop:804 length:708 start_codon:yes stop_codon:yes gene_type:complete